MTNNQNVLKLNCLASDVDTIEFYLTNDEILKISATDNSEGLEQETLICLDSPDIEKLIDFLQKVKDEMK